MQQSTQSTDSILEEIFQLLPAEFAELAFQTKALQRTRQIENARQLLRLVFLYCGLDFSLRQTAATLTALFAQLSDTAVFKRLKGCQQWLGQLIQASLSTSLPEDSLSGFKASIVDSTVITGRGSKTSDYRGHLKLDLERLWFEQREVTDGQQAESLARSEFEAGELVLGDRNYARAEEIVRLSEAEVCVLVRFNPAQLKVWDEQTERFDWLRVKSTGGGNRYESFAGFVQNKAGRRVRVWVHRYRLSAEAFAKVKAKLRRKASKRGQKLKAETIELARYVWVITNVEAERLSAASVLQMYGVRWQIEIWIKRLKSMLGLGGLPSKVGSEIAEVWLLGKLLYALLLQKRWEQSFGNRQSWEIAAAHRRSSWREWQMELEVMRAAVVAVSAWRVGAEAEIREVLQERSRRRRMPRMPRDVLKWMQEEAGQRLKKSRSEAVNLLKHLQVAA